MTTDYYVISDPFIYSPCGDGKEQKMTGATFWWSQQLEQRKLSAHPFGIFYALFFIGTKHETARIPA
jgi:hypothetical protein